MDTPSSHESETTSERRKLPLVVVGCMLSLLALGPFVACAVIDASERGAFGGPLEFESDEWKANQTIPFFKPVRFRMHHDLIWDFVCIGKSPAAVEALLGPADQHPRFVHPQYSEETLIYFLRRSDSDGCSLRIYAENGVVRNVITRGNCRW